jgi:lysyl-tRNA synthetase class 2
MNGGDFRPTASLPVLRWRAEMLRAARLFFDDRGYWEVDTPLLSSEIVIDAWLEPFACAWLPDAAQWSSAAPQLRFLQTSPEFAMKRLLASGADAIYQLGKVFRNGETGRRHNPEFTMLEWYRLGDDHHAQMEVTENFVRSMVASSSMLGDRAQAVATGPPFLRLAYDDAFATFTGIRSLTASMAELHTLAREQAMTPPPGLAADDRDGWFNWLLAELVEPQLGKETPVFLCDFPATQAALAKTHRRPDGVEVAHRFELYIDGVEFCNGYHELTDPAILRERMVEQSRLRAAAGLRPLPHESRLLAAMEAELPESAGVALGFDRLLMFALGTDTIETVIPFPFARA